MVAHPLDDTPRWYVLNYVGNSPDHSSAQKTIDHFNRTNQAQLQLFAPTFAIREEKNGIARMKTVKLAFHYTFVNGTFKQIKTLCNQQNGFSFLINHSSEERYATISDAEMHHFKAIARAYQNALPYLPLNDIDLQEGDLVEVVNGDFPGLIGTFMPKAKSNSGNIILMVYNNVGTIAYNIKASDVRVLQFAQQSTRANDQIDAFVPHLLLALNHFKNETSLPKPLAAKLVVFCRRMEIAKLNNNKLNAKLQALLFAANTILGNTQAAQTHLDKYNKLKPAITNPWTIVLTSLVIATAAGDPTLLAATRAQLPLLPPPTSKSQRLLLSTPLLIAQSTNTQPHN